MSFKFLPWLQSNQGRRVVSYLAVTVAIGASAAHVLPHTYGKEWMKAFYQMYRSGTPVPVGNELQKLSNEVLAEFDFVDKERDGIKFFTVVGFDTFHLGSTKIRQGTLIGLPCNFEYKTIEDIDKSELLIHGTKFSFASPVGQELLNSFILSENAQRFAIAREINAASTYAPFINGAWAGMFVVTTHSLAAYMNNRLNLFRLPTSIRFVMYLLTGGIGLSTYLMLKDSMAVYYDKCSDEGACKLGKDYALGGKEFYEKALQRNMALRKAMGEAGKKTYTSYGNEEVLIRTKRLPLTARLDIVKDILGELECQSDVNE